MSKKRTLADLKKNMELDEVESKIAKELAASDNEYTKDNYLAYYDASLINKSIVQRSNEESDENK